LGDAIYLVNAPNRLHVVFGVVWTIFMIVHLALHWKWIAATSQRYIQFYIRARIAGQSQNELPPGV
jgi:hypothetical protein